MKKCTVQLMEILEGRTLYIDIALYHSFILSLHKVFVTMACHYVKVVNCEYSNFQMSVILIVDSHDHPICGIIYGGKSESHCLLDGISHCPKGHFSHLLISV